MRLEHAFHTHAERLISGGRLTLALGSLAAILLDPFEPTRFVRFTYLLLIVYCFYAGALVAVVWRSSAHPWPRLTHAVDLAVFSSLVFVTEGPSSPFFVYFVFATVAATMQWSWRGTATTTIVMLVVYAALAGYAARVGAHPELELSRFIVRTVYLAVISILLAYLGWYQSVRDRQFAALAEWPARGAADLRTLLTDVLERARQILHAQRMLLVWEDPNEPWLEMAIRDAGGLQVRREPPASGAVVAEALRRHHFFCHGLDAGECMVLDSSTREVRSWRGAAVNRRVVHASSSVRRIAGWHVEQDDREFRLLALECPDLNADDLVLGELVARAIVSRLTQHALLEEMRHSAVSDERLRLARNLHDGVLQSLTGIALQLQSARRLIDEDRQAAELCLDQVQRLLATEQYEIRSVIHQLRPEAPSSPRPRLPVAGRLREIVRRVERQWGVAVTLVLEPDDLMLSNALFEDVLLLAQEALINAMRHAHPTRVELAIRASISRVRITVTNDGRGFAFAGTLDLPELTRREIGPRTLRERVIALAGELQIASSETGACVRMSIPTREALV